MLSALCGNKNIEKVLIFLFVNGKCYGTQLHRLLKTSLTPLQNAFSRLERGGVIRSSYEGKTRVYQFNPAFPLLEELEQLLKKAYIILSAEDKKSYCIAPDLLQPSSNKPAILEMFWNKLTTVRQLSFNAKTKSKDESGWNGKGTGEVIVLREGSSTLIFQEKGSWRGKQGEPITFSNQFRWKFDQKTGRISLEHLRFGAEHPVFLFHLAPTDSNKLSSVDSHLCGGDIYFGQVHFDHHTLRLNWRVIGPKKNEEIDYCYY